MSGRRTERGAGTAKGDGGGDGAASAGGLRFVLADYADPAHGADLIALLDDYARDPSGGGEPLPGRVRERLVETLGRTPNAFSLLGYAGDVPVALANCFETLSSFACRPLVNVHDLAVASGHRGRGVGRALLGAIEREARARDACKITLEVLEGNAPARRAYERAGFRPYVLGTTMGTALFLQRTLDP